MPRVSPPYTFHWQEGQDSIRISGQTALNACHCNCWKMRDCKPKKKQCSNACQATDSQTLHMIAWSKCPGNSERREFFRQFSEVSMVCPGNMPIFVATTPLAPLVFQTAGMKCISGCKVWTKFLSVASLLTASKSTISVSLILAFWLKVYWKLAQKNVFPMQWYHKRMQRTACSEMSFDGGLQVLGKS